MDLTLRALIPVDVESGPETNLILAMGAADNKKPEIVDAWCEQLDCFWGEAGADQREAPAQRRKGFADVPRWGKRSGGFLVSFRLHPPPRLRNETICVNETEKRNDSGKRNRNR
jgi:hypothetical protein